jgi:hypothetical protein
MTNDRGNQELCSPGRSCDSDPVTPRLRTSGTDQLLFSIAMTLGEHARQFYIYQKLQWKEVGKGGKRLQLLSMCTVFPTKPRREGGKEACNQSIGANLRKAKSQAKKSI